MKKLGFLILFLVWTAGSADVIRAGTPQNYGHQGQDGIILAWNGSWDIGIGSIEGGIGYKRWISEKIAIKSSVTFGKVDTNVIFYDHWHPPEYRLKEKSFSLLAGVEDHFWRRGKLSFYFGGTVQFKTSSSTIDYQGPSYSWFEIDAEKIDKNTYTIQGSLGLEYFFSKRLSLSGQYVIDFSLEKQSRKETLVEWVSLPRTRKQQTTTWRVDTGTSLLVLTIYP